MVWNELCVSLANLWYPKLVWDSLKMLSWQFLCWSSKPLSTCEMWLNILYVRTCTYTHIYIYMHNIYTYSVQCMHNYIYIHVLTHICKYNAHPYMYLHMYGYTCVLRLKPVPLRNLAHRQIPLIPQTSLHLVFHFHTSSLISWMNGLSDRCQRYTLADRLLLQLYEWMAWVIVWNSARLKRDSLTVHVGHETFVALDLRKMWK